MTQIQRLQRQGLYILAFSGLCLCYYQQLIGSTLFAEYPALLDMTPNSELRFDVLVKSISVI